MSEVPIPERAWKSIKDFLQSGKTGSITLDVKQGYVLAWKVTEYDRISNIDKQTVCDIEYSQSK